MIKQKTGGPVIIAASSGDVEASAVTWALRQLGCHAFWWRADDVRTPLTLRLDGPGSMATAVECDGAAIDLMSARTVWLRSVQANLGDLEEKMDPEDAALADRELDLLRWGVLGLTGLVGPSVLWANPRRANNCCSKAAQLAAALEVGLAVPRTLMTNDVDAARRFIAESAGPVVFKSHELYHWIDKASQAVHRASPRLVSQDDLDDPQALRLTPGIFQHYVRKVHELRITVFGATCIAVEIRNQDPIDWRSVEGITVHPFELPTRIEEQLIGLLRLLGLTMGMCDVVVDEHGRYNFLEVNQQGQFLFLEERNRDIRLLEPFARFLASGRADIDTRQSSDAGIRFRDYVDSGGHEEMMPYAGPYEPDHVAHPRNRFKPLLQPNRPEAPTSVDPA